MAEEAKDEQPNDKSGEQFTDVSHLLKKSKRGRTPNKIDS